MVVSFNFPERSLTLGRFARLAIAMSNPRPRSVSPAFSYMSSLFSPSFIKSERLEGLRSRGGGVGCCYDEALGTQDGGEVRWDGEWREAVWCDTLWCDMVWCGVVYNTGSCTNHEV